MSSLTKTKGHDWTVSIYPYSCYTVWKLASGWNYSGLYPPCTAMRNVAYADICICIHVWLKADMRSHTQHSRDEYKQSIQKGNPLKRSYLLSLRDTLLFRSSLHTASGLLSPHWREYKSTFRGRGTGAEEGGLRLYPPLRSRFLHRIVHRNFPKNRPVAFQWPVKVGA